MAKLHFAKYRNNLRLTHYLFRFPAKFHPPVVRRLVDQYTTLGDSILDPFCGSGTLLVEALLAGKNAVGIDIDPLAAFISRVKSKPISPERLERDFERLREAIAELRRPSREYDRLMHKDLPPDALTRVRRSLHIPAIPNIEHWFRVYVVLDLAALRKAILDASFAPGIRDFFLGCFASIIRNASNADPVPVSGLEVTAHMRRLDAAGRRINPFELFEKRVRRQIDGMRELWDLASDSSIRAFRGDATTLRTRLGPQTFDIVITSPPYNTAVDYYRRHMLEMYWLELVQSHEERALLAPRYLGRSGIRKDNTRLRETFESPYIRRLITHAKQISPSSERAVTHYCASMERAVEQISLILKPRGQAVFVLGNSKWNGRRVRATQLIIELAKSRFKLVETFSYGSCNRYMSYTRQNGANINREYVLVLKKRD